ncbi:MAG: amino acid adenylation domain-containing protein [Acidobacteriota bacterium]
MSNVSPEGFRLSVQQRRAWAQWHATPAGRVWCALSIHGPLDADRLHEAAKTLSMRHEILRTTFHREPGMRTPFQVVGDRPDVGWTQEPGVRETTASEAVKGLVARESETPWNLGSGPLFRLRLATLRDSAHLLLVTLPALCADRQSLHEISRQLVALYTGTEDVGGPDPIQYADYAQWQEDLREAADEANAGTAYWKRADSSSARGKLPLDALQGSAEGPGLAEIDVAPGTTSRIEAFCFGIGTSVGEFLFGAWVTLLARLTGESNLLVRLVDDARHLEDLRGSVGRFALAVPIPWNYSPEIPFSALADAARHSVRAASEWTDYFREDEETGGREDRETPGFAIVHRPELPGGEGIAFSIVQEFAPVERFPVWLDVVQGRSGLRLRFGVDHDRLAPAVAERLAAYFQTLLDSAAANLQISISELPLLTDVGLREVVAGWNDTAADFPRSRCVHELFEEQAARTPTRTALVFDAEKLTYEELNARANRRASRLRDLGVGRDVRVGLCLERSAETIVLLLSVLKAGGAYVPMIPDHPALRLESQLEQSGCKVLITHSRWKEKFPDFPGVTLCVDRAGDWDDEANAENVPGEALPASLAYVMHTSGSTGTPKGVAVRHENLVNYSNFIMRQLLGLDPQSPPLTFATVSTVAADLGNTAIFPSLLSGGCLQVVPYETAMEGSLFAEYLSENPVDVLKIVPSHFAALLASAGEAVLPRRALVFGGEPLSWGLVEAVQAQRPECDVVNHYGPTETTVGSLTYRLKRGEKRGVSRSVPVGRPIANTSVFILDTLGWPVPFGVPGELYIGGAGVAAGYVGREEETAAKFTAPRFPGAAGPLYRTGDRVRYLGSGDVEFLGRVDDQVKIRGFRVEPGDVRATLQSHPGVREAVVVAREDSSGDRRLVGYVVPRSAAVPFDELRMWMKARLPDYMVPSAFVALKWIPLTPNGKVDRNALPPPDETGSTREYVAPRTASEQRVVKTWLEVLKLERIGADDNFFDLGGHSLLLTQVVSRLRKVFNREVPIRWLFEVPTVSGLAERIDAAERDDLARMLDELEALPEQEDGREVAGEPPSRA